MTDSQILLYRSQYFGIIKGSKTFAKLPQSWKKGPDSAVVTAEKAICCTESENSSNCDDCDKKIDPTKKLHQILLILKKNLANSVGLMLPCCFGNLYEYLQRVSF